MNNIYLRDKNAQQIDRIVEKLHSDLGYPEPPLNLEEVRRLCRLDIAYYKSSKESLTRDLTHGMRMAGATLFEHTMQLWQAIKTWDIKAILDRDERRILIDQDQPKPKWRWSESHEVIHSLLSWHGPLMTADAAHTLSPDCVFQMEAEANFGSGRLLFLRDRFLHEVRSVTPTWKNINNLATRYGNTKTSTLWRTIESLDIPAFGIVGYHPIYHIPTSEQEGRCRYFIRSPKFLKQFSQFPADDAIDVFESYCNSARGGPLGHKVAIITDDNGDDHEFHFESFSNTHEALTIATYLKKKPVLVAV